MIRRIELVNFMSHTHTVIEPAAGLTVLFGPNNCGKSAVVTALQILCHNENSTYVTRHGERECSVSIETDDGHVVQWRRRNSPSYMVDGVPFDRLGRSGAPDELHDVLRLPKVSAEGNQEFDVHFGEQKSPVFLVDKPGSHAAQFFASSSDAAKLVEMQKRHQQKSADAKREQAKLVARVANLSTDLENFKPIDDIGPAIADLETRHAKLQQQAAQIAQMPSELAELQRAAGAAQHHATESTVLGSLASPPVLGDTSALRQHIEQLTKTQRELESQADRTRVLQTLLPSPDDTAERSLAELVGKLAAETSMLSRAEADCNALGDLAPQPGVDDPRELRELINHLRSLEAQLVTAEQRVEALSLPTETPIYIEQVAIARDLQMLLDAQQDLNHLEKVARKTNEEQAAAAEELRSFATQNVCPTCGAALDPENLISHAGSHGAGARLPEAKTNYVGLLLIGDPHLEGRSPGFRMDDYAQVILDKLAWSLQYAEANRLLPALLGDLFDKPRDNPTWMIGKLIDLLTGVECLGLYGNHDCANPQLDEHDSLSLLVKSGRVRLLDGKPWEGIMNGRQVFVGGSSYRQPIPEAFPPGMNAETSPLVVWLTHHDLIVPGYEEQGRFKPREIPGVDLVINGHIHRQLEDVVTGQTRWITPGNISRRSRSDATREHQPAVLRIDISVTGFTRRRINVPHQPFDAVFHSNVVDIAPSAGASSFVAGLAELQARRTASGAGLVQFLEQNIQQFEMPVAGEIMALAREIAERG